MGVGGVPGMASRTPGRPNTSTATPIKTTANASGSSASRQRGRRAASERAACQPRMIAGATLSSVSTLENTRTRQTSQ